MKKVLIAHQSTIPHYRVPFYQAVERLRPGWWEFAVIYNVGASRQKFFLDLDAHSFGFRVEEARSYSLKTRGNPISYQGFLSRARHYDLVVAGSELNNISYPLAYLWRYAGKSVAYWGHGRDSSVDKPSRGKKILEKTKIWLARHADGFFAYTDGVCRYMISNGVDGGRIFVLRNTIDIERHRAVFNQLRSRRDELRKGLGLAGKRVLLFVGRLNRRKRLDFLLEAFALLRMKDSTYHLIMAGGGDTSFVQRFQEKCGKQSVDYQGTISDDELSSLYAISDLYVFPGAVGLGPLQALCFDLTPTVIDSSIHNPEYEYLNRSNGLILPAHTTPEGYAWAIDQHLKQPEQWRALRSQAWPSIRHLTIENMAKNFIHGVNSILSYRTAQAQNR